MDGLIGKRSGKVLPKDYEVCRQCVWKRQQYELIRCVWEPELALPGAGGMQDADYLKKLEPVIEQLDEALPDVSRSMRRVLVHPDRVSCQRDRAPPLAGWL